MHFATVQHFRFGRTCFERTVIPLHSTGCDDHSAAEDVGTRRALSIGMTNLAISSVGEGLPSAVDPRFGRAKYFVVVDLETNTVKTVSNSVNLNAVQGAGIQAAKTILDLNARKLITGHVGPKAFAALQAGGVTVYPVMSGTVAEALEQFKTGSLTPLSAADVEGHW